MTFEFFIGRRYLRSKQQAFISLITFLSIAGVTVGVMALIVVIAVMAGFEEDLKNRILGVESHLVVMRYGDDFNEYEPALLKIEGIPGVTGAVPFIYGQVMLRSKYAVSGAVIRGVEPKRAKNVIVNLDTGALLGNRKGGSVCPPGYPPIILGKELAKRLGVRVSDTIVAISSKGILSPMGHLPVMKSFCVAGLFESGMYEFDGSLGYMNLDDAARLFKTRGNITGIEVRIKDIYKAKETGEKIEKILGYPFWTKDWMQMNRNLFSALKLEKTVMFIILALIVMVAAFNIASSLIMMVMEKKKDIAILKAMGATSSSIRRIFIFKGMIIGGTGTALGVACGFILCFLLERYRFIELPGDVYYITTLPVRLEVTDVLMIALAALLICFLSTLYPSKQAAKQNPVDAVRHG